jgi:hypothetical protein
MVRNHRSGPVIAGVLVSLVAAGGLAACGGGGSGDKVSFSSLSSRLLPAAQVPGFDRQRTFDWSDPVNLVGEGVRLPEASHPSSGVKAFAHAGLRGAAGERLTRGAPPDEDVVTIGVAELESASAALRARDWMHGQDLQQPCYTACIYSPRSLKVPGVPTATAVMQVPHAPGSPPPGGPGGSGPPTHYLVEFTVGPYLYFVSTDGRPGDRSKVVGLSKAYYERERKRGS